MSAQITFYPLGNADTALIRLADDRLVLVDYANMRDPADRADKRCDLPTELKKALREAGKKDFAVVCFSHLDEDHVKGMKDFFWLEYLRSTQVEGRPKIEELWVPAAAVTETGVEDDAWAVRQEARYRLIRQGRGIKVFSRPEALKDLLDANGLSIEERRSCIVNAGDLVPGFTLTGPAKAEFFVHCPFGWRLNEREVEDRNQDSIVFQATFREGSEDSRAIFGSDVNSGTLAQIVQTTRRHGREDRLKWDILKLYHHCSYKSLNEAERSSRENPDETKPAPEVKWLIETQGQESCSVISPSKPIPTKGSEEDENPQPPHRQAKNYYVRIAEQGKDGEFLVTMERPSKENPKPIIIEITDRGHSRKGTIETAAGTMTSRSTQAG
jgi:hypothetical protein